MRLRAGDTVTNRGPLRLVVSAELRAGRGSVLGPDNNRRVRWWDMVLDCGHVAERIVKYRPTLYRMQERDLSDVVPAPTRCRCDICPVDKT